ncbi:MAG: hypothetical protein WCL51_16625 [Bacteroidota bacterium]
MREFDDVYFRMFGVVRQILDENKLIWETNPIINDCYSLLDNNIKTLKNADVILMSRPTGITINKKSLRKELNLLTFLIKEALRLYYRINGMEEDMLLLTYPITKLQKMLEDTFYVDAISISKLSIELASEIAPFGITQIMIDDLKDGLVTISKLTPERDKIWKKYATTVKLIPVVIKETLQMLKNILDPLISIYQLSSPDFHAKYVLSRKRILKPGKHKHYTITIVGKLLQADSLVAINNVKVIAGKKKKTTISDIKGNYKIKIYIKDADTITFSHEGYETLILDIPTKIIKNQVVVNVKLMPKKEL